VTPFDPARFSGHVPLFPLPNVVLLPWGSLPLHIFEPRYRSMTEAALKGERLIAMALLKPGWEPNYKGNPPVHDVVGIGTIVAESRLPDGRFNLVLLGVARARVLEVTGDSPYRTARVRVIDDRPPDPSESTRLRAALLDACAPAPEWPVPVDRLALGNLCDFLAGILGLPLAMRQELLEQPYVAARGGRLLEALRGRPPGGSRQAPAGPSLN
jgi:hypothetical protein